MRKTYIVLILCVLVNTLCAQDEMFKSLFLYNFTKNIEWPDAYKSGDFVITVVGNSPIIGELEKIAKLKKVGNQSIVVKKVNDAVDIEECHMVYLTPAKSSLITAVYSRVSSSPIVIIGDKEGLANEGAGLNFVKIDGKQKFEINMGNLEVNGLKVNSYLSSLGIVVK